MENVCIKPRNWRNTCKYVVSVLSMFVKPSIRVENIDYSFDTVPRWLNISCIICSKVKSLIRSSVMNNKTLPVDVWRVPTQPASQQRAASSADSVLYWNLCEKSNITKAEAAAAAAVGSKGKSPKANVAVKASIELNLRSWLAGGS